MYDIKLKDFIKIYNGVLPPKICSDLIDNFEENSQNHEMSKVGSNSEISIDYRHAVEMNCSILSDNEVAWKFLITALNRVVMQYQQIYIEDLAKLDVNYIPESKVLEEWRMHRYDENKHFYKPHVDSENTSSSSRMLSLLFYLNDVESGGETSFTDHLGDISCSPVVGRLLIFPSWMGFPHEAKEVIKGSKYIIKTFIHYPGEFEIV